MKTVGMFEALNDTGKSPIFDARAFFDHPLGEIDGSDIRVHTGTSGKFRTGCVFFGFF